MILRDVLGPSVMPSVASSSVDADLRFFQPVFVFNKRLLVDPCHSLFCKMDVQVFNCSVH